MKKILFAATIFSIFSWQFSISHAQNGTLVDGVAAVVGKNIVKYSDIERSLAQMRMRSTVTDAQATRCAILENLILTQLLVHKGEVDSIEVQEEQVKQYLDYYPPDIKGEQPITAATIEKARNLQYVGVLATGLTWWMWPLPGRGASW